MSKNIVFNKYYKHLRNNVFSDLEYSDFIEVFAKFIRLSKQYRLLKFANKLERLDIKKIEFPILKFLTMFIDFLRWKLYDLLLLLINGRTFNEYGLTCYCGRQGGRKNCFYG